MITHRLLYRSLHILCLLGGLLVVSIPVRASVTLVSFRGTAGDNEVFLEWETDIELDNAGFYIRRGNAQNGPFTRISSLIPSQGDSLTGTTYSWTDDDVVNGTVYWYQLESVDLSQSSEFFGPISVTPGSTEPTVTPSATPTQTPTVAATGATLTSTPASPATTSPPSTAYPAPATATNIPTLLPTAALIPTITTLPSTPTTISVVEPPTAPVTATSTLVPLPALTLTFPAGGIIIGGTSTPTQTDVPAAPTTE
ncbi:MAG: hypothetical protein ACWGO1_05225, partial [Anaerolineales bacterium]